MQNVKYLSIIVQYYIFRSFYREDREFNESRSLMFCLFSEAHSKVLLYCCIVLGFCFARPTLYVELERELYDSKFIPKLHDSGRGLNLRLRVTKQSRVTRVPKTIR